MMATLNRIWAMVLRHLYLMRKSWPRVLEMAYWPTMQMITWGFLSQFMSRHSDWVAQAPGLLISAVLLWDVLFRSQIGVALTFFEELYSRNLGHLFVSPLKPIELVAAQLVMSLIRTLIGVGIASGLAVALYRYSPFDLGPALVAYFSLLMVMGWAVGLMASAVVLRHGLGAENIAWAAIFAVAPFSGIYYPIDTLPHWLRPVAWALPSSHVFEGMRGVMIQRVFEWRHFYWAAALDGVYLVLGILCFLLAFRAARRRGLLLQVGE